MNSNRDIINSKILLIHLLFFGFIPFCISQSIQVKIDRLNKEKKDQPYIKLSLEICEDFSTKGDFENAKLYCNKSIDRADKIKDENALATVFLEVSGIYLNANSTNEAFLKESFEQSKNGLNATKDTNFVKQNLEHLKSIYYKSSDQSMKFQIGEEIVSNIEKYNLSKSFIPSTSNSNKIRERYSAANRKLQKLKNEMDDKDLENKSLVEDLEKIKNDFDALIENTDSLNQVQQDLKKKNVLLQQENVDLNEIIDLKEREKKLYLIIAILGALISSLLIYGIYRFRMVNKKLSDQNKIIEAEKKKSLNALKREANSQKALKERERIFYTNVTHEIRTPLTVIDGMASKISKNSKKWADEGTQLIKKNTGQILNLVNAMLDISKLESGHIQSTNIQSDIIAYIIYIVESLTSYADSKGIKLNLDIKTGRCMMDFDIQKVRIILVNLISNAIKYNEANGNVTVRLEEFQIDSEPKIQIDVIDNGIGILEEDQAKLFDRYFQAF